MASARRTSTRPRSRPCSTRSRSPIARHSFTVGIEDDVSHTNLALDPDVLDRARRRRARPVLRPRRGRHGRRQQEQREDHRRRSGDVRPGLLRLRLAQVRRPDGLAPALRQAADPRAVPDRIRQLRRLPPGELSRPHRRATAGRARGHVPAQHPLRPGRGVGPSAPFLADADPRQEAALLRDRRVQGRPRGGAGQPDQHRAADLLLRHLRRAAARAGDRAHQALDRGELRRQGRRRRAQEFPGRRRRAGAPPRGACSGRGDERRGPFAAGARQCAAVRARGDRADDGGPRRRPPRRADARRRHLPVGDRRVREAQCLGHRRRVGSGAVRAVRPVRLRLSPQRHPRQVLRRAQARYGAPDASSRRRSTRGAIPTFASRCSSTSRTAPAAASASRSVPSTARAIRA